MVRHRLAATLSGVVVACAAMSRLAALSLVITALGCGGEYVRCDELDNACNRPLVRSTQTIRAIRTRAPRLPEATPADLRAVVVTAYDTFDEDGTGRVGGMFFQEISPNPAGSTDPWSPCPLVRDRNVRVCALSVFSPQLAPSGFRPVPGDMVDVTGGGYTEFTCAPCGSEFPNGRFIPQVSNPTVTASGVAPTPVPIPVTIGELVAHNAELLGNLVTVENLTIAGDVDRRGEVSVGSGVNLAFQMIPATGITRGTRLRRVTGIAYYFYGVKLIPRSVADVVRDG